MTLMRAVLVASASLLLAGPATAQGPFVDVPPCHWAADAVGVLAGKPQVDEAEARASHYLAENSVRQVFEGMRCGSAEWTAAFVSGAPDTWQPATVANFTLDVLDLSLEGGIGRASVAVELIQDGQTTTAQGELDLRFDDGMWKVDYESLRNLVPNFFS